MALKMLESTRFACRPDRLPSSRITGRHWYYAVIRLPKRHVPLLPVRLRGHTRIVVIGSHDQIKNLWVSLVALKTRCIARVDLRLRDSLRRSPKCDVEYCLPACKHLGQDPTGNHVFGAQSRSGFDSQSIPFTLTTSLFTLQATTSANGAYTPPAKLDTGRAANTYPGGNHTRLSSNHFQSAHASHGSA